MFAMRRLDISLAWSCQCSHDKSKWNSEMGALVLKALISPIFSLQEGDEWTMARYQVNCCQGGDCWNVTTL